MVLVNLLSWISRCVMFEFSGKLDGITPPISFCDTFTYFSLDNKTKKSSRILKVKKLLARFIVSEENMLDDTLYLKVQRLFYKRFNDSSLT